METKIDDLPKVFPSVDVLRKASLAVLFAPKAKFLVMLLLPKSMQKREWNRAVEPLLGVAEGKVDGKVSKRKVRDIGLGIGSLEGIEELLRSALQFSELKR
jgi:hypothetical protein